MNYSKWAYFQIDVGEITIGQDWAESNNQGQGYIWINGYGKKWFIDKNLMAKTDYPSELPINKIRIIRDDDNKIIGLINSDGRQFNKYLLNSIFKNIFI